MRRGAGDHIIRKIVEAEHMLEVDPLHFENIERASGLTLWN